jgi:Ca2+-binding RTX toxin-like protein
MIVLAMPAASTGRPRCLGAPATIVGTRADDGLEGTNGPDVIVGLGGTDVISGLGGDDLICGGPGGFGSGIDSEILNGGRGHDRIKGGADLDTILGRQGSDVLSGGNGSDYLYGGGGSDRLDGGRDADSLTGDADNDRLDGGGGYDWADFSLAGAPVRADLRTGVATGVGRDVMVRIGTWMGRTPTGTCSSVIAGATRCSAGARRICSVAWERTIS